MPAQESIPTAVRLDGVHLDPFTSTKASPQSTLLNQVNDEVMRTEINATGSSLHESNGVEKGGADPAEGENNTGKKTIISPFHKNNKVKGKPAGETVEVGNLLGPYNGKPDVEDTNDEVKNDEVKNDEVKNDPHNPFELKNTQLLIPTPP